MSIGEGTISAAGSPPDSSPVSITITNHVVEDGPDRMLLILVDFNNDDFEVVSSVVWDPTGVNEAATFLAAVANSDDARCEIWYLKNPTAKTADVVVTLDSSLPARRGLGAHAISLVGVEQGGSTFGTVGSSTGTSTSPTTSNVPAADREYVIGITGQEASFVTDLSADSPAVQLSEVDSGGPSGSRHASNVARTPGVSPNAVINWTSLINDHWAAIGVEIRAAQGLMAARHPTEAIQEVF